MLAVDLFKLQLFYAFTGKELDDLHSGQAFLHKAIQQSHLGSHLGKGDLHRALKPSGQQKNDRHQ